MKRFNIKMRNFKKYNKPKIIINNTDFNKCDIKCSIFWYSLTVISAIWFAKNI